MKAEPNRKVSSRRVLEAMAAGQQLIHYRDDLYPRVYLAGGQRRGRVRRDAFLYLSERGLIQRTATISEKETYEISERGIALLGELHA